MAVAQLSIAALAYLQGSGSRIGRTDLWGGDQRAIVRSIKERLYRLDEEATVVTGHGPDTRLGDEMRENPFVRA